MKTSQHQHRAGTGRQAGEAAWAGPRRGFTLIEIMVAVGIVAMFMTIAIPTLFRTMNEDSMRYASEKVLEICRDARARAILDGRPVELRIRGSDRSFSILAVASPAPETSGPGGLSFEGGQLPPREDYQWGERMRPHAGGGAAGGISSFKLGPSIVIEELDVAGGNQTGEEEGRVRFYPNGTADAMILILRTASGDERRKFGIEEVTGLAEMTVESR